MDMDMLKTDVEKFNFIEDDRLCDKGFSADVKKEIYRFPSILLLDICIVSECAESTSWESLEALAHSGKISQDLFESMKFLLAAATYIRLSTYLHHDSHDDRMALSPQSIHVRYLLGDAYSNTGQYEKAEQCFLQVLQVEYDKTSAEPLTDYSGNPLTTDCDIQDKVDLMSAAPPEDRLVMITHNTPSIIAYLVSLGNVYRLQKKYSTAEAYFMKALQFIRYLYGDEAAVQPAADTLNNNAAYFNDMKQCDKAEDYSLQALTVYRQISHRADRVDIANTLSNLAINYNRMEQYYKAEDYYLQALSMKRQFSNGAVSVEIAQTLYNIALNYSDKKQYNKAEDYYLQALTVYKQISHGSDSVDIAGTLYNLGVSYAAVGENIKSREVRRQALDIYMRLDPLNPNIVALDHQLQLS